MMPVGLACSTILEMKPLISTGFSKSARIYLLQEGQVGIN
jgi:hypothetical protein